MRVDEDGLPINQLERRSRRRSSTARSSPPQPQPLWVRADADGGKKIKLCHYVRNLCVVKDVYYYLFIIK